MLLQRLCVIGFLSVLFTTTTQANVVLQSIDGQHFSRTTLSGKWVFINYWASWCEPCLEEIPEFNRFYEHYKPSGNVMIFGVNYDFLPLRDQKALIKQFDIRYPSLKNDPAASLRLGDVRGVPVTFVINPKGKLVHTLYGGQTARSLAQIMQ